MSQLPYNYPAGVGGGRIDPRLFEEFERWVTTRGIREPSPTRPDIPGDWSRGGWPWPTPPYYPGPFPQDEVTTRGGSCGGDRDIFGRGGTRGPASPDDFPDTAGGQGPATTSLETGALEAGVIEELRNCSRGLQAFATDLESNDAEVRRDASRKAIACANYALGLLFPKGVRLPDERFTPTSVTRGGGDAAGACREFGAAIDRALRDAFGSRGGRDGFFERIGDLVDKGNRCVRSL